ncbi:MAG TPA: exodeoxyribonuclease V subunit gamma [Acidimicrobiales bacterium]|nr:exodeoxyribonuclease V subunit gamma [Acidimicrobiales bacterium]
MMHLYSAGDARPLAARLAAVLADPPADPMTPEWLAVPSDGMRRWLTLELASRLGASGPGDGVAANFTRAYPGTLRGLVLAAERDPAAADPWSIDRLVWEVLGVADEQPGDRALVPFVDLPTGASRFASARRIADLLDRYHLHRPDMVRAWAAGRHVDGTGRPIAPHAAWQPHLWQLVRRRVGEPSPPERWPGLLDRMRNGDLALDLPRRLVLFGFALLPGSDFLELAGAVAEHRDLHLFMLEPAHLDAPRLLRSGPRPTPGQPRLRATDPASAVEHPLLRSWGRLHRETALMLADARARGCPPPEPVGTSAAGPSTVLGRLQHHIRADTVADPLPGFEPTDRSIQFHACYGPTRQVEVLRDAILHLLASDPGLTEDDVLVLCPALERFAPLVEAVFGPSADRLETPRRSGGRRDDRDAPSLRYRIADRSIRRSNPVVGATTELLDLVVGRFDAAGVLDFCSLGPVRERFRFDDEDLASIGEWVRSTNVRWGLDAAHRVAFGVPETVVTNTWQAALDRLLLGSAVHDADFDLGIGEVAPFGCEGSDVETAGRLAEVLWRLGDLASQSGEEQTLGTWVGRLDRAVAALFAGPRGSEWQAEAVHRILAEAADSATGRGEPSSVLLTFTDLRRMLDGRLDSALGRPDFFRGGVTITSMTPMRGVPFRVVCLLGMDQWAFAPVPATGDDLAAAAPRIGDGDPRGEARQALLEAVLAAGDHLMVVYDGRDVRTNQEVPRAVPTAELFDAVSALVEPGQRKDFAAQLETVHPRHPFDDRCFASGALVPGAPWGFDPTDFRGAGARRSRVRTAPRFLGDPLEPIGGEVIELARLHSFLRNPARAFLTERLEARLPDREEEVSALLPMDLVGLHGWRVGDRLLGALMAGAGVEEWRQWEQALGTLPPGALGDRAVAELVEEVYALVSAADGHGVSRAPGRTVDVGVNLADGTRIVGSVPLQLRAETPGPARVMYTRGKAHHRLAAWLDLMALVGTDPTTPWRSVVVARGKDSKPKSVRIDDLVSSADGMRADAVASLSVAVDCYRRGMTEPLPLFPSFSREVYDGRANRELWNGRGFHDGADEAVRLVFGAPDYDEIVGLPTRPGDPFGTPGRVAGFARHLWDAVELSIREYGTPPADQPAEPPVGPQAELQGEARGRPA